MAKGVTIESLAQRIAELESRPRSLNEDYQLEAYILLLSRFLEDEVALGVTPFRRKTKKKFGVTPYRRKTKKK